uniref:LIM zinc-binding domain-containing protein n=1 Tax=Amphiprion percula TaxID=161767 RepID=A0A3P8UG76_AMPPE
IPKLKYQRVYVMERLSAEGLFFHRSCFRCDSCSSLLRPASYSYNQNSVTFYLPASRGRSHSVS